MSRIDFYVLQSALPEDRFRFAVRLTEKAWQQRYGVVLLMENEKDLVEMDQALWTTKPESFLPHGRAVTNDIITLVTTSDLLPQRDLLINLSSYQPANLERYPRLAEIVIQHPLVLEQTRVRYGHYKERRYEVNIHKLG